MELASSSGQRGGARAVKGENIMMQYIENADGTPITGDVAAEIWDYACSLWRQLDKCKAAPEKWGNTLKDIRENYYFEMESKFYVLRLCENHWKSQAIATAIYSQWYNRFVKKRGCAVKSEGDTGEEPAAKRPRGAKNKPPPGPTSDDAASIHKVIIPIDPLADVFDTPNATPFAVLNRVPKELPLPTPISGVCKLPGNSDPQNTQAVGRGTTPPPPPPDSVAPEPAPSPGTPSTPSHVIETLTAPPSGTPLPPLPPAIEPHIPGSQISSDTPVDPHPSPAPPSNTFLVPPSTSGTSLSSSTIPCSGIGEGTKTSKTSKKYIGSGKMIPGGAITAMLRSTGVSPTWTRERRNRLSGNQANGEHVSTQCKLNRGTPAHTAAKG
ncbi:hypothetical protein H4582DRAFT_2082423 [Lactarius indigo]|nr:hypothetical protein H4582DRAFT_2082423 [Lactarius indigo]